jgi:hypothetical protein
MNCSVHSSFNYLKKYELLKVWFPCTCCDKSGFVSQCGRSVFARRQKGQSLGWHFVAPFIAFVAAAAFSAVVGNCTRRPDGPTSGFATAKNEAIWKQFAGLLPARPFLQFWRGIRAFFAQALNCTATREKDCAT